MRNMKFRRLERYRTGGSRDNMELSYPIPRSPSGKIYQYSPNNDAVPRLFLIGDAPEERKINEEDRVRIRREPGPGQTVCPYSGYIGDDDEFVHFDDVEAIKKQVEWEAAADISDYLADMAKDFNRRQPRNSFISFKMDVKPSRSLKPLVIRQDLLRDMDCNICNRSYGVYAISLFCPDCGAPNIANHFKREINLIKEQIVIADAQVNLGKTEIAYRLMGNAHEDVLTAFETSLKTVYKYLVKRNLIEQYESLCTKKAIGNAFQNIARTKEKYNQLGINPFNSITPNQLSILSLNIQKRHVIGHNLGIADEFYVELTQKEQPGETVILLGREIGEFADICGDVVAGLEKWLYSEGNLDILPIQSLVNTVSEQ